MSWALGLYSFSNCNLFCKAVATTEVVAESASAKMDLLGNKLTPLKTISQQL
jgi:hypothetical protein